MALGNAIGIGIPMVNLGLGGGGGGGGGFLLDDYPNTNGHSYSLRQLSSTVTNVVRVRRSSDNTEQDFSATGITDGTLASFCGEEEGFVTKWYDQSGSIDVLNFTALQQPKIVSGGSVLLENGKPCIEFDGVDDSLQALLSLPFSLTYYLFAVNTFASLPPEEGGTEYMYGMSTPSIPFPVGAELSNSIGFETVGLIGSLGSTLKLNTSQFPFIGGAANGSAQVNSIHLGETSGGSNSNIKLQEFILYFVDPASNATAIESNINTHYSIY